VWVGWRNEAAGPAARLAAGGSGSQLDITILAVEHLCREWAGVVRAILIRRRGER
jgi:hypothetical protein